MFGRMRFLWKFTSLAALILISALIVSAVGFYGAKSLKAEYDNLYGFMLIPINQIQVANEYVQVLRGDLMLLYYLDADDPARADVSADIQDKDAQVSQIMTAIKMNGCLR
jgi:methyl-accepting chemotaxis protein